MRQHSGFSLQRIHKVPYLLPFGQQIADHRRGLQINETGVFIWNALLTAPAKETLFEAVLTHYEVPNEQRNEVIRDTEEFLSTLALYGMVEQGDHDDAYAHGAAQSGADCCDAARSNSVAAENGADLPVTEKFLTIAGLTLVIACPESVYPQEFVPFETEDHLRADGSISVHVAHPPVSVECGTLLLQDRELTVRERSDGFFFTFPSSAQLLGGSITKDGTDAQFYLCPPACDSLTQDLFHAIRLAFLYLAQLRGRFVIHSASILYKKNAWLFSGHSGMGKSTHTNLWHTHYGTPLLNGDLNLMELTPQGACIHGLPWCGTSGISTTESYPLGGIVLLGRCDVDLIDELTDNEKALLVMQRFISPFWTVEQLETNLAFASALTAQVPVCRLRCTKSVSAVETVKLWMESPPV